MTFGLAGWPRPHFPQVKRRLDNTTTPPPPFFSSFPRQEHTKIQLNYPYPLLNVAVYSQILVISLALLSLHINRHKFGLKYVLTIGTVTDKHFSTSVALQITNTTLLPKIDFNFHYLISTTSSEKRGLDEEVYMKLNS